MHKRRNLIFSLSTIFVVLEIIAINLIPAIGDNRLIDSLLLFLISITIPIFMLTHNHISKQLQITAILLLVLDLTIFISNAIGTEVGYAYAALIILGANFALLLTSLVFRSNFVVATRFSTFMAIAAALIFVKYTFFFGLNIEFIVKFNILGISIPLLPMIIFIFKLLALDAFYQEEIQFFG